MRLLIIVGLVVGLGAVSSIGEAQADGPNRAGLVVGNGDSFAVTCVEFDEPEITGLELLNRSGLPVVQQGSGLGTAICGIQNIGCSNPNDCWCQCHGTTCSYWAYFNLEDGAWRYSATGASPRKVQNGDVDAWIWGSGGIGTARQPPTMSFEEICPEETQQSPEPAATPVPVSTDAAPTAAGGLHVETATPVPSSAAISASKPTRTPFHTPLALNKQSADEGGPGSGFPWSLLAFGVLAVGLLAMAVALMRRRSHD
jgi:hypothetical protein